MMVRRLTVGILGCAAVLVAPTAASAATLAEYLPPEVAGMITSGSADAAQPLLPLLPPPPFPAPAPAPAPAPRFVPPAPAPPAPAKPNRTYKNCTEVRNAGAAPLYRGEAGYAAHLDRDNDGIACEG